MTFIRCLIWILILVFFVTSTTLAETSNSFLTPELKQEILEKMQQMKNIEKPGLRSSEEIVDELYFHVIANAALTALCEPIINETNIKKRRERIEIAEMTIVGMMNNPSLKVPAFEKSLAYAMLTNLANLKNDRKKAEEYITKAFENNQQGLSYYERIKESPIARFNILLFKASMQDFFKIKENLSTSEVQEIQPLTQKYPLLKERLYAIAKNLSILNALNNLRGKK